MNKVDIFIIFVGAKVLNMKIYHNNRCSKSRQTLELLNQNNQEVEVVEYLKTPLTAKEIRDLLNLLGISAFELVRKGEEVYKKEFKGKDLSEEEWIAAMESHPKLIERPIVVKGDKAVIGRPPERVLDLI